MQGMFVGAGMVAVGALAAYLRRRGVALAAQKPAMVERTLGISQLRTFPWGKEPLHLPMFPFCMAIGAASVAAAIALTTPSGPMNSLDLARGPVAVSLMWVWAYYNHIGSQLKVKLAEPPANEQAAKIAERSLYNTIEQGIPFLLLLGLTAACVDSAMATSCGKP